MCVPLLFENTRPKFASSSVLQLQGSTPLEVKPVCLATETNKNPEKNECSVKSYYTFQPVNIIDDADQTMWICRLILHFS